MDNLTQNQIYSLAKPLVAKYSSMVEFYENPENEKAYREWYFEKYGKYPTDEVQP